MTGIELVIVLLFIIYINDFPNISKIARFILYADDANIIVTGSSIHEVMQKINLLSNVLVTWVGLNGLALNLKKTKFMIFARQRIDLSGVELKISNMNIERKSECRFLGVIMDDKLNWSHHIASISLKMSRYLGIMFKIKHRLPVKVRILIFHSFVQSHLNYCPLIWGFSAKSHIQSLFTKQKQGIRAVMPGFVKYWYKEGETPTHTKNYFKEYEILTVHGVIVMNTLLFMHKISHFQKLLPSSIVNTLPENIPKFEHTHHDCLEWLAIYNNIPYRTSVFNKGPLLALSDENISILTDRTRSSVTAYKKAAKCMLLKSQHGSTDDDEWPQFLLHRITGIRKSARNAKSQ